MMVQPNLKTGNPYALELAYITQNHSASNCVDLLSYAGKQILKH
jgi:hypothetical protein